MTKTPRGGPASAFDDLANAQGSSLTTTLETAPHAVLEIGVVVASTYGDDFDAQQTIIIPLDEAEAQMRPEQVLALRTMNPISSFTKVGDVPIGFHACVRAVVLIDEYQADLAH